MKPASTFATWNEKLRSLRHRSSVDAGDHDPRRSFGHGALWTAIGTYLPGAGLIKGGRRMLAGTIAGGLFVLTVAVLGIWALVDRASLLHLTVNAGFLRALVFILPVVTLGWLWLIISTHLDLKPRGVLTQLQRGLSAVLVAALCLTIAAPMAVASRYAFDQSRLLETVFRDGSDIKSGTAPSIDAVDPWKNKARLNVLLLGGDAGEDRYGTRTDTILVASIDTKTGNTLLVSIPRNTANAPFPEDSPLREYYPDGFSSGWAGDPEHMFNNIYDGVPANVPQDILGPTDDLGADAVKLAAGEATGLPIDYYALVDLEGFSKLVNALGGITVNINTWVAMGGDTDAGIPPSKWLRPGPNQHLNGTEALWFARGRYGADDFQRMDRQRCVIEAAIKQVNPTNMLARYEDVARQSKDIVHTDVPQEILPAVLDLTLRVRGGERDSIVLRHGEDGFWSENPDWDLVRARVQKALEQQQEREKQKGKEKPTPAPEPSDGDAQPDEGTDPAPSDDPAPAPGESSEVPDADQPESPLPPVAPPEDLATSCEFQPEVAAEQPPEPPS